MYLHEDGSLVVNGGGGGENLQLPWKMEIFRGDLGACILNLTPWFTTCPSLQASLVSL